MLKDILTEMRQHKNPAHKVAADLVELADRHTMTCRGVAKFPDLLKAGKIKPASLTEEVFAVAAAAERLDKAATEQWVKRINTPKVKFKASPLVKAVHRVLLTAGVSLNPKGAFKARKQLAAADVDMEDVTDDLLDKVQLYQTQLTGTEK